MGTRLVVALNLEWDDLGPEREALAAVGAEVVTLDELDGGAAFRASSRCSRRVRR